MVGFSGILDIGQVEHFQVIKEKLPRQKEIVSRFKDKSVKIIKDANGKIDDYSISPKIRQILLHWYYESVENNLF